MMFLMVFFVLCALCSLAVKKSYRPRKMSVTERERAKSHRSRRESLMSKILETDDVCGCSSFLLTLRLDNGGTFFAGDPVMITRFFGEGVSKSFMDQRINIRPVGNIFFSVAVNFVL